MQDSVQEQDAVLVVQQAVQGKEEITERIQIPAFHREEAEVTDIIEEERTVIVAVVAVIPVAEAANQVVAQVVHQEAEVVQFLFQVTTKIEGVEEGEVIRGVVHQIEEVVRNQDVVVRI